MNAAVLYAARKIETRNFPVPRIDENTALVQMIGSAICGTDKHVFQEGNVRLGLPGDVVKLPIILGHENIGIIEEIGSRAKEKMSIDGKPLSVGERVAISADIVCGNCYYCKNIYGYPWCLNHKSYGDVISCDTPPHLFGGYSEMMYILPGTYMARVPKGMSNDTAVLTEQMAVAYGAFGRAVQDPNPKDGFSPSDTVVVQGVGPLGMCNALMARMMGAGKIITIDKSEFRLKLAKELHCAHETINLEDYPNAESRVKKVYELTDGLGADLVIECTGFPDIVSEGLDMLRLGGTYLVEGAYVENEGTKISPSRQILAKNARIIGASGMPFQAYHRVLQLMWSYHDIINFDRAVTHHFPVESAQEAMLTSISSNSGKVVVAGSNR